jgi:hypothetical protein
VVWSRQVQNKSFLPEYLPSTIPIGLTLLISNGGLMKGPIRYPFSSSLLTNNDISSAYLVADNTFLHSKSWVGGFVIPV